MIDDVLSKLIAFLENASPMVWQTLLRQVRADAIAGLFWAGFLLGVSFGLWRLTRYALAMARDRNEDTGWMLGAMFGFMGVVISALASVGNLVTAFKYLYNPEFYAIQYIISQIK